MDSDDDYVYSIEDIVAEAGVVPSGTVGDAGGHVAEELPLVETQTEQTSAGLPVTTEKPVEPAPTEKLKKKTSKRQRTSASSGREKGLSTGRQIDYREVGFVEDKMACANVLYALKHPEASGDVPPLSELEESEAYVRYARSEMRNQAFLNKIIVDYQRKLNDARQALKDAEHSDKLRADLKRQCLATARLAEKLEEKKGENNSLQADLAARTEELAEARSLVDKHSSELEQVTGCYQRSLVELKALGGYSDEVKARADRLRERLVYLNKVKTSSKRADQARSTLKCLQGLVNGGVKIPQKVLDDMEKHATGFEAKVKEFESVDLEEGDLTPLGAYVPKSGEFEELLGARVPPEHDADEPMRDADEEALEAVQDPAVARSNEEEGGGGNQAE